jgi:hypothetical protein
MQQQMDLEKLTTVYWSLTIPILIFVLAYHPLGFIPLVMMLILQVWHFYRRQGSITALSVQVRITYLLLALLTIFPMMFWMIWPMLIGTIARVVFQYCFLARCLSLFPWNRTVPLTWKLVSWTFFSPPTNGSILHARTVNKLV